MYTRKDNNVDEENKCECESELNERHNCGNEYWEKIKTLLKWKLNKKWRFYLQYLVKHRFK